MSTLDDDDRRYLSALFEPIRTDVGHLNHAVFGEDGRGGLTQEMAEARGFAKIGAATLGLVIGALGFLGITISNHRP